MPATKVTLKKAGATCSNLGKRLCSVDEWKAAAIGWEDWSYPYGKDYDGSKCNTEKPAFQSSSDSGGADTVGQNPGCVSSFGIYDLSGNVAEWVAYNNIWPYLQDSLESYSFFYIGGSWSSREQSGMDSRQSINTASDAYNQEDIGFRCCKDPKKEF
jgi:formylglycine-generating enzyme required for sulfatase activity